MTLEKPTRSQRSIRFNGLGLAEEANEIIQFLRIDDRMYIPLYQRIVKVLSITRGLAAVKHAIVMKFGALSE